MVRMRGGIMDKSVWKAAVKSVRKENQWKRPTKKDLAEAARRYLERENSAKRLRGLIGGIVGGEADGGKR
jgi:hypothetical protein